MWSFFYFDNLEGTFQILRQRNFLPVFAAGDQYFLDILKNILFSITHPVHAQRSNTIFRTRT